MADYISSYTGAQIDSSVAYTQAHDSVHTEIDSKIASIESILSEHFGEDVTDVIDTFDELKIFLNSYKNSDSLVTILSNLETELKAYADGKAYDDTSVTTRLSALEAKGDNDTIYDDSALVARVEALEAKGDNDTIYDDSALVARVAVLEAIDHTKYLIQSNLDNYALKTDLPESYDDSDLVARVEALEAKGDNDTVYDDSALVARVEALESKEDKDTVYDDSSLISRIETLEAKEDNDTVYDDTEVRNLIATKQDALSDTQLAVTNGSWQPAGEYLTEHQDLSDYAKVSLLNSEIKRLEGLIEELEAYHSVVFTSNPVEDMTSEEAAVTNLRVSGTEAVESLSTSNNNVYKTLTISE